jgi:hypothetical protein
VKRKSVASAALATVSQDTEYEHRLHHELILALESVACTVVVRCDGTAACWSTPAGLHYHERLYVASRDGLLTVGGIVGSESVRHIIVAVGRKRAIEGIAEPTLKQRLANRVWLLRRNHFGVLADGDGHQSHEVFARLGSTLVVRAVSSVSLDALAHELQSDGAISGVGLCLLGGSVC